MANDKKPEGGKAPAKVETINLKVFIHCEGCKKKVKKILNNVEGVHTVDVDGSLGKVTVTGTVDSKTLIKKLEKAGKVAEVLASGKGKEQQKDQQKGENKEAKEEKSGGGEGDKKGKGGGGGGGGNGEGDKKGQGNNNGGGDSNNNKGNNSGGGSANNGESGKKKKGGGGDGGNGGDELDEAGPNKNTANKNIAPIMVETGYSSMESAEYATHIFSDENANNCHIM